MIGVLWLMRVHKLIVNHSSEPQFCSVDESSFSMYLHHHPFASATIQKEGIKH